MSQIPISIITGFLGSGKTTLLSKLLNSDDMQNTALIINEFGEIGIDNLLVKSSVENTLLLENGCVCCSIRGDLSDTISGLFAQSDNGDIPRFDYIIIETTGLAQPGPIVQTIKSDISLNTRCEFDKVITVVDCISLNHQIKQFEEPVTQIIQADFIYLSKTDIAKTQDIQNTHDIITSINSSALVKNDINSKLLRTPLEINFKQSECFLCSDGSHNHQIEHDHSSHLSNHSFEHLDHLLKFKNWSLNSEKPINKKLFRQWLASLYSLYPLSILRLKGFVNFENNEGQYLIQAVGPIITEIKLNEDNQQFSALVFIFKDIEIQKLQKSYELQILHPKYI